MQGADQLLGLGLIRVEQGAVDVLAQRLCFSGHQIATDPVPDRFKRYARKTADALVVSGIVDEERFDRHKEHAGGIADTPSRSSLEAGSAAQFLKNEFAASRLIAAQ